MGMRGGAGGEVRVACAPRSRHGIRSGHGIAMKMRATSPTWRFGGCHPPSEHSGRPWSSMHAFSTLTSTILGLTPQFDTRVLLAT